MESKLERARAKEFAAMQGEMWKAFDKNKDICLDILEMGALTDNQAIDLPQVLENLETEGTKCLKKILTAQERIDMEAIVSSMSTYIILVHEYVAIADRLSTWDRLPHISSQQIEVLSNKLNATMPMMVKYTKELSSGSGQFSLVEATVNTAIKTAREIYRLSNQGVFTHSQGNDVAGSPSET